MDNKIGKKWKYVTCANNYIDNMLPIRNVTIDKNVTYTKCTIPYTKMNLDEMFLRQNVTYTKCTLPYTKMNLDDMLPRQNFNCTKCIIQYTNLRK